MTELLAPAGTLEKLVFALQYGADAVYAAGPSFGMRAYAGNFTLEELRQGIGLAHQMGRKVYITVNIVPHNEDLEGLPEYIAALAELKVDALILSDPAVLAIARDTAPHMELHLSTQANAVNWRSVRFWHQQGISRVILARELSLTEIATIRERVPDVELEVFVHGAMCISYSGRCMLSMYMTGRDANKGACANPCRYQYALVEEKRPGQYYPIEEDERGTYIMNSKDLCMLPYLKDVLATGVDGLKIEGRMKSVNYVATITRAYRLALSALERGEEPPRWIVDELGKVSHRDYTTGFFYAKPDHADHVYGGQMYQGEAPFLGIVRGYDRSKGLLIEQRGHFRPGQEVEVITPSEEPPVPFLIESIGNAETGEILDAARHAQQLVYVPHPYELPRYAIVRQKR
jgi:putative protease